MSNTKTENSLMKKNYFVYYGTEENAFEIKKNGAFTESEAIECVKDYLDTYMYEDEKADAMAKVNEFKQEGVNLIFDDKIEGYVMFVGIAPKGKLRSCTTELTKLRREIVEMFD